MFKDLLIQEVLYWLKRPATYFFTIAFCVFSFLMMLGSAGWFDPHVTDGQIHEHLNSYFGIHKTIQYLNKLMIVLLPAIVGSGLYKDYKYRVHSILFTFPVRKIDYLLSRFCASFLIVITIGFSVIISMIIASVIPGLDPAKMGPLHISAFLQAYFLFMVPNLLFVGALVFAVVLASRNIYFAFIGSLFPFIIQIITENAFINLPELIALFDPFGQNTVLHLTKDWTLIEKNEWKLPITETILFNRIIWTVASFLTIGLSIKKFRLHEHGPLFFQWIIRGSKNVTPQSTVQAKEFSLKEIKLSGLKSKPMLTVGHLSKVGLIYVLRSPIFWGTIALAIIVVVFAVSRVTQSGDMILMPATKIILLVPSAFYSVFCMLLIFIYTGLLIRRESNARMHALVDSTATPFWVFWSSKLLTMIQLELILMLIFMITGIIIQSTQGYYHYELALYLKYLIGFTLLPLFIWTLAAFFIHTIIDNLYVALFILLFGWIGVGGMPQLGIDTYLLRFNTLPELSYSDMNGFGHGMKAFFVTQGYWLGFGMILLTIVHVLWPSGTITDLQSRLKSLRNRTHPHNYSFVILGVSLMIGLGMIIGRGENAISPFSGAAGSKYFNTFKKEFETYSQLPIPKIRHMSAEIELYPNTQRFSAQGNYFIENPDPTAIDTLMIRMGFDEISTFELPVSYKVIAADSIMNCYVILLDQPIPPEGQLELTFSIQSKDNTLFERNSSVLKNGTFLKTDIFPRFGYSYEAKWKHPDDSTAHNVHYQSPDADLVDLDITIGTTADQRAIGPGRLVKEWHIGDRNYYQYTTDQPIKFSFGINSGMYQYSEKQIYDQMLEVYAHHTTNLQSIEAAVQTTLPYLSAHFSPYAYPQIRVIEFPDSEGTYATAFANNLPTSEIRFIANTDPTGLKTDLSFYVPAHELIHHWWGANLIPARAQGATMLTESLTEYFSLKVYQQYFGPAAAKQFLNLQHQRYWNGHRKESRIEPPLFLVTPEQQYISYGKGAVVMNGLSQLLGEATFNQLLTDFMDAYERSTPPYPTSTDFIHALDKKLPDSIRAFVHDHFETVSYLETQELKVSEIKNGEIRLSGIIHKWELPQDDTSKTPLKRTLNEWIEVGLFDSSDTLIKTQWVHLTDETFDLNIIVQEKPARIELDPNYLVLIKKREQLSLLIEGP